jgi:hypothetical protein
MVLVCVLLLVLAAMAVIFWAGNIYGQGIGAEALAEERKISDALRAGLVQLTTEKQAAFRRVREYAAQIALDVKKIGPWLGIVLAVGVAMSACSGTPVYAQQAPAAASYWHDGAAIMPDPKMTPGVIDADLTMEKLCDPSFHTGTVRNVPESEKRAACREYGISQGCPGKGYEIDHLVSIELGGSNDLRNLWPQPVDAPGVIGFHTKDVVENRAHRAVCQGQITLLTAQLGMQGDWYAFGRRFGFIR